MNDVTAGSANHLLAPGAVTAKTTNEAAADDPCPNSAFSAMDQLPLLANRAAATLHVNNSRLRHAPLILATWKRLIACSGLLSIVDWLGWYHMDLRGIVMNHRDLVMDRRLIGMRVSMMGGSVMRHSSLLLL
jgi:hypothetical protein